MGVLIPPSKAVRGIGGVNCIKRLAQCQDTVETQQTAAFMTITTWFRQRGVLDEWVLPTLGAGSGKLAGP